MKPPLGFDPEKGILWEALVTRYTQVIEAMQRYLDHRTLSIPQDWIDEYYSLVLILVDNQISVPFFPIDEVTQHNSLLKIL